MKYLLIILTLAALALFSCSSKEDKVTIPADIISPDSMVGLFVDFHLAEAACQLKQQERKDPFLYTGFYYSFILKKHNTNRKSLDKTLQFYSNHPKLLREIYEKVLSELSTIQSRAMQ